VANQALREFFKKIKLNGLAEFLAKIKWQVILEQIREIWKNVYSPWHFHLDYLR
jgi:hypothetical protein